MTSTNRRLLAVMFTDVVGYTALMQRDEEAARITRHRHRQVLEAAVSAHGGELLQYLGDGSLTVFPSVGDAVRAAIDVQRGLRQVPVVPLRIGIHQGDISYDTQGAYGDSVNVASRIQSLGTTGSILISGKAQDEIKNQPDISASSLGAFELKNVQEALEVHAVVADGIEVPTRVDLLEGIQRAPGPWNRVSIALSVLALALTVALGWLLLGSDREGSTRLTRFSSPFEEGQSPAPFWSLEFTADGSALVYAGAGASGEDSQLWMRRWSDLDAVPIPGTEGVTTVALSPDGREVVFAPNPGALQVAALAGGPSRTLVDQVEGVSDWASDGYVYFTKAAPPYALARVPAAETGSQAVEILTEVLEGEFYHTFLTVLPGERMAVFQVFRDFTGAGSEVWAIDLDTHERHLLTVGHTPRFASTGHLLFANPDGVLMAAPIESATAELTGPAVPVVESLAINVGVATYAVSEGGTLIYASGRAGAPPEGAFELAWVTRSGEVAAVDPDWRYDLGESTGFRLSPDGARVAAMQFVDGNEDIYVKRLPDGVAERLTQDDLSDASPFWSPDGRVVAYSRSDASGNFDIWQQRADGTGSPQPVLEHERSLYQGRWSVDGEWMVFRAGSGFVSTPADDILGFRPGVDSAAVLLVADPDFSEQSPALSPNGRWLAYTSDQSGRIEVYVRPFPDVDSPPVPVSRAGGANPLWAHNGRELVFRDPLGAFVSAEVEADSVFRVLRTETLFTLGPQYPVLEGTDSYDIAPDDERFLVARLAVIGESSGDTRFVLIENWFTELLERVDARQ